MKRIVETKLITSTGRLDRLPEPTFPEVAFAGRSNVGKSSLLNTLTGRKGLFKVSSTPGRTRTIVHVETRLDDGASIYLVDLPGYGYAKVSKGAKKAWAEFMHEYLESRQTLHLVVVLVDVRRGLEEEEWGLLEFMEQMGVPAIIVATKLDKEKKSKRKAALNRLRAGVGVDVIGTSAAEKIGMDRLLQVVLQFCGFVSPPNE